MLGLLTRCDPGRERAAAIVAAESCHVILQ